MAVTMNEAYTIEQIEDGILFSAEKAEEFLNSLDLTVLEPLEGGVIKWGITHATFVTTVTSMANIWCTPLFTASFTI